MKESKSAAPVPGGASAPQMMALQCMCSGVYFRARSLALASSVAYTGTLWKRRHPGAFTTHVRHQPQLCKVFHCLHTDTHVTCAASLAAMLDIP